MLHYTSWVEIYHMVDIVGLLTFDEHNKSCKINLNITAAQVTTYHGGWRFFDVCGNELLIKLWGGFLYTKQGYGGIRSMFLGWSGGGGGGLGAVQR